MTPEKSENTMPSQGVICAIDVNDYDQDVIDLAALMAGQLGVRLDLVHVTLFPNTANKSVYAYVGETSVYSRERERLSQIQTSVPDVEIETHHVSGYPADCILAIARKYEPQLLILGTHGRHGLAALFGSVATEVLASAACPVMVLRRSQNDQSGVETGHDAIET